MGTEKFENPTLYLFILEIAVASICTLININKGTLLFYILNA